MIILPPEEQERVICSIEGDFQRIVKTRNETKTEDMSKLCNLRAQALNLVNDIKRLAQSKYFTEEWLAHLYLFEEDIQHYIGKHLPAWVFVHKPAASYYQ